MELRQLRYFAAVVTRDNCLHLTQSAVSGQVQNLEAEPSRDFPIDAWPRTAAGRKFAMATEPPDLQMLYAIRKRWWPPLPVDCAGGRFRCACFYR